MNGWARRAMGETLRQLVGTIFVIGLALVIAPTGYATPSPETPPPPSPYPDEKLILRSYAVHEADEFFTASANGVWFTTPSGLNCGIWDRGSFGCQGVISGAPDDSYIGWVTGNIVVRHDWLLGLQFPPGAQAERPMPPRSYVNYLGTMCAVMADTSTYCSRGPFKFFVTPTQTWLSPP